MNIFNKHPFLIAEIGINYWDVAQKRNIDAIDAAKLMIDEAKSCGADAVKFYSPDSFDLSIYLPSSQCEFEDFSVEEYRQLSNYCKDKNILFLSIPHDFHSVDYLDEFMDIYMISSSDLTNIPFIKYVLTKNKPIIISTGASTIKEIKDAVDFIENESTVDLAIMHSVLSCPVSYEDSNLLMIKDLIEHFPNYEIGYTDYTVCDKNMFVLTSAFNLGASILEKPFTLDKSLDFNMNKCAMDAGDVKTFKENIGFLSIINGKKNKQPLICESSARKELRKSIVSSKNISKGDELTEDNLTFKKPGTGIHPSEIDEVIGKIAIVDIQKDAIIDFEMFEK